MGIKKRCQSCGKPYTAERDTSLYCGPTCRKVESRKRLAGNPEAIPARRTAAPSSTTSSGASRTVTLMLTPGTSVELPPDLAAKIAPHLPVPGIDGRVDLAGWEVDERPLRARQRTGDAPWEEHPWETKPDPAAVASAGAAAADDGSTPATADGSAEVLSDGSAAAPRDTGPTDSERERWRREDRYSQTEDEIWEALADSYSITAATKTDLGPEGVKTPWGRNALMLAMRLDYARLEKGSAVASLSREYRAALREAKDQTGAEVEDEITAGNRRRAERREAAARAAAAAGGA